jgi:formamidopyrimidine-DNA glycosylase
MPELPEVETIARELNQSGILDSRIERVHVAWARTLASPDSEKFQELLIGRRIQKIARRGKFLVFHLSGPKILLVHLRMTGQFYVLEGAEPHDPHLRVSLGLDDGKTLCYKDTRKFERWHLVDDVHSILGSLGPEPFDDSLTTAKFWKMLSRKKRGRRMMKGEGGTVPGVRAVLYKSLKSFC